jgi:hypothetical protein
MTLVLKVRKFIIRGFAMATAVYDNSATMRREVWIDGVLISSISQELTFDKLFQDMPIAGIFKMGGEFRPGWMFGDPNAIKRSEAPRIDEDWPTAPNQRPGPH